MKTLKNLSRVDRDLLGHFCGREVCIELPTNEILVGIFSVTGNAGLLPPTWPKDELPSDELVYQISINAEEGKTNGIVEARVSAVLVRASTWEQPMLILRQAQILPTAVTKSSGVFGLAALPLDEVRCLKINMANVKQSNLLTDNAITQNKNQRVAGTRELAPWSHNANESEYGSDWLDRDVDWDQFKYNEKKFGLKNTFRDDLYTTKMKEDEIPQSYKEMAQNLAREVGNRELIDDIEDDLDAEEDFNVKSHSSNKLGIKKINQAGLVDSKGSTISKLLSREVKQNLLNNKMLLKRNRALLDAANCRYRVRRISGANVKCVDIDACLETFKKDSEAISQRMLNKGWMNNTSPKEGEKKVKPAEQAAIDATSGLNAATYIDYEAIQATKSKLNPFSAAFQPTNQINSSNARTIDLDKERKSIRTLTELTRIAANKSSYSADPDWLPKILCHYTMLKLESLYRPPPMFFDHAYVPFDAAFKNRFLGSPDDATVIFTKDAGSSNKLV